MHVMRATSVVKIRRLKMQQGAYRFADVNTESRSDLTNISVLRFE